MLDMIQYILLFVWQFPQNIIALVVLLWTRVIRGRIFRKESYNGVLYLYAIGFPGAISLGQFVILNINYLDKNLIRAHEFEHARQSRLLGPLYLFIIGIPSIMHAAFFSDYKNMNKYYEFYTESWADKLGGVSR